jgi:glucose/arabinose dehydrogenase/putative cell wall-binding protein
MSTRPFRRARRRLGAPVCLLMVLALLGSATTAAAEAALPAGFSFDVIETGAPGWQLTDFAVLSDGGLLTAEKRGRISHVSPVGIATEILVLANIQQNGERGLIGIEPAPDYADSGHVYGVYTHGGVDTAVGRLSRWTVTGHPLAPTGMVDEQVILDGIPAANAVHTVGTVLAAPDGSLYLGSGDQTNSNVTGAEVAQDLDAPPGKILRVLPDGSGHPDNPFYDPAAPSSWRSRVYAYGLRNPFRFTLRPGTSEPLYVGDVGSDLFEELNVVAAGDNHGWPCWEGEVRKPLYEHSALCQGLYAAPPANLRFPVWAYGRHLGASVTGGVFYAGDRYPEPYAGSYFLGDWSFAHMWSAAFDEAHQMVRPPEPDHPEAATDAFASSVGHMVRFRTGLQGDVYLGEIVTGEVRRLEYGAENRRPRAVGSVQFTHFEPEVQFFGDGSTDPDGDPLTYLWDFGDGSEPVEEANPRHTYPEIRTYRTRLTVTDPHGERHATIVTVPLDDLPPAVELSDPPHDQRFAAGEAITLSARAVDDKDGVLDGRIQWQALLHHCPPGEGCHTHPGAVGRGPHFETFYQDEGPDTELVITASVTDSVGQRTHVDFTAVPDVRELRVESDPPGAAVTGPGLFAGDGTVRVLAGTQITLEPAEEHAAMPFRGWLDGGPRIRTFPMPRAAVRLLAGYRPARLEPERIAGPTRTHTAITLSQRAYPDGAGAVLLARSDLHTDALAAAPLAALLDAPLLLTAPGSLHTATAAELERLGPEVIYVLGGTAAISEATAGQAVEAAGAIEVHRLSGGDRIATAAVIARWFDADRAYLVDASLADPARGWADAVSVSALAATQRRPILLTTGTVLADDVRTDLARRNAVTIVGGSAAVPAEIEQQAAQLVAVDRLSGPTRYDTAAAVARRARSEGVAVTQVWLATGRNWPDALSSGGAVAKLGGILLLVDGLTPAGSPVAWDWLQQEAADVWDLRVVGGPAVVTEEVALHASSSTDPTAHP